MNLFVYLDWFGIGCGIDGLNAMFCDMKVAATIFALFDGRVLLYIHIFMLSNVESNRNENLRASWCTKPIQFLTVFFLNKLYISTSRMSYDSMFL